MPLILLEALRIALVAVFGFSAVSKLWNPSKTVTEFTNLGVPFPSAAAYAIPGLELMVCAALVAVPAWGGVWAFVLLVGFTTTLVSIIRSGRVVNCACFGALTDQPVSWHSILRNAVLLAGAFTLAVAG